MALTIVPTVSNVRWGRRLCHRFDQLKHPTRDATGNPCVIYLHGGGGITGNKEGAWSTINGGTFVNLAQYFNTVKVASTDQHFDLVSLETRQKLFLTPQFRGDQAFFPETILDVKRGIIAIKTQAAALGIDPNKLFLYGESHGAWKVVMTMCTSPLIGNGGSKTEQLRRLDAMSYDSVVRGYLAEQPMVDVRRISNVDQIHFSALEAWFGTRSDPANSTGAFPNDTGLEWAAVPDSLKAAASPLAYVQNGDTRYFRPLYLTGARVGNHTKPYADPAGPTILGEGPNVHDSQQGVDLAAAMTARGLNATLAQFTRGDMDTFGTAAATAVSLGIYTWLTNILAAPALGA